MNNVYISSTYQDLSSYRTSVYRCLRKMQYNVIAMEDYVAKDERTLKRCCDDVRACDIYVGIIARRYGYIPPGDERQLSITELEYRTARESGRHCLLFALDPNVAWPEKWVEKDEKSAKKLASFRCAVVEHSASMFRNKAELVENVMASVHLAEADVRLSVVPFWYSTPNRPDAMNAEEFQRDMNVQVLSAGGDSAFPTLTSIIGEAAGNAPKVVWIDLGSGKNWWSTRLFALAVALSEKPSVYGIAFSEGEAGYIGMFAPVDVHHNLATYFPELQKILSEANALSQVERTPLNPDLNSIQHFIKGLRAIDGGEEKITKWLAGNQVKLWSFRNGSSVELTRHDSQRSVVKAILSAKIPYVALTRDNRLVRVIDRAALASNIALGTL